MNNTNNFIMSPKVDFAFKELMRDETVRKGFLSAVLGIKDTDIKKTVLLNTNLLQNACGTGWYQQKIQQYQEMYRYQYP